MGDGAAKPGLPFIRREAVCAIVRNPKNGTYLCNSWKGFRMNGLFTGGIEPGEDLVEGAKREVREETGYKNLKHVRTSDLAINTYFYHRVKKQNRHAHFKFVFFDLMDDERAPVDENESAVHEVVWKKKEELKDFFTVFEGSFVLNILDGDDYVHVEPGILSRSGAFDGMDSVDAMRKITDSVGGKWVVKYKLKDWVFSRQRYWGEPFPIVHSSDYADVVRAVTPKLEINFYKDAIWEAIINGAKKIETRVLNPDEPERFFGSVQPGDFISGANKTTGEKKIFKVKSIRSWKNIAELWADRSIHGITFSKPYASLDELRSGYADLAPAYAEKADKNGIAGWELEMVTVPLPVSDKDLPVELPKVKSYEPTGTGESPLAAIDKWVNVKVGKGKDAKILKRETNTMPQWAGSSWYYLRYMDPHNDKALVDAAKERYWNEVDFYVGGAEHATRHLIYARFWHKFLYDIGVVSTLEPFKRLQSVGLIMGEDGRKMSKRFGNVVNPDEIVNTYGADTLRVYEMFMGPFDQAIAWSTSSIVGSRRFVERVWRLAGAVSKDAKLAPEAEILLNKTIKKVSEGIAALRHNTAVSSLMILSNELERAEAVPRAAYETLLKLVAPFAPHVAEELWASLGNKGSIHVSAWPVADEGKLSGGSAKIVVQVNGKVRASFEAPLDADKASLEATALALDEVKKWVGDKKPTKVIVVPGKLVSIVARQ
ncbi:MAG TPA: class I tRNA ligase family protein [Candidatus Paceibacterota bacterium]|nr:class I tRNA ligase family protein [Candidatus Paceibacterota bacterium]